MCPGGRVHARKSIDPSRWTRGSPGLECMKISSPASTFPPLFLHISLSSRIVSIPPYHPPLPPWLASLCPPACLLLTNTAHFCLSARRLACSLEPAAAAAAEDWEDLRHACGSLPTCLCVLDHWCLYPPSPCVCVCVWMPESRDPVSSYRDNHWTCFKYLLNHTSPAFTYKCTQIDFPIQSAVLLWHAKVVRVSLRVRVRGHVCVFGQIYRQAPVVHVGRKNLRAGRQLNEWQHHQSW